LIESEKPLQNPLHNLIFFFKELRRLARISDAHSIARRLFVTNSFDGLISTLGIILGGYLGDVKDPTAYIYTVAGGMLALGIFSGMIATYLSERAERLRELHETEKVMLHKLDDSIYAKVARYVPVYVAFWSGIGALLLPLLTLVPFVIASYFGTTSFPLEIAIAASTSIALLELFLIGCYLGKISGENKLLNGLKFVGIGLTAAATLLALKVVF